MHIKICGITNLEDALLSIELGATMIGFNFYPLSKRYISPNEAKSIILQLPKNFITVGTFVNHTLEEIKQAKAIAGFTITQLHGDEEWIFCNAIEGQIIKTIKSANIEPLSNLFTCLIDAVGHQEYGGTGKLANWETAKEIASLHPLLLAGGLNHNNINNAIKYVKPFGVDICSKVEARPGKKSPEKLMKLFKAIHDE